MNPVGSAMAPQRRTHTRRLRVAVVLCLLLGLVGAGISAVGAFGGLDTTVAVGGTSSGGGAERRGKGESEIGKLTSNIPGSDELAKVVKRSAMLKRLMLHRELARETIFVNTASFRDVFCRQSVRSMYEVALHPERVFMGIIDQRLPGDEMCIPPEYVRKAPLSHLDVVSTTAPKDRDPEHPTVVKKFQSCWKSAGFCPLDNLRFRIVADTEARGPTYGRFVAGLLFQGESFYMMIDSHSIFAPHFDELFLLDTLRMKASYFVPEGTAKDDSQLNADRNGGVGGVLSNYPGSFNRYDKVPNLGDNLVSMCRIQYIDSLRILRNGPSHVVQSPRARPLRHPHTAGGFLFSDSTVQLVVPYDPYLDFVFDGEEVLYSIRLFTRGFDAYMPSMPNIFHHYERHKAPRFWSVKNTQWTKIVETTRLRVHYFMQTYHNQTTKLIVDGTTARKRGVADSEAIYAPGKVRSVQSFYDYAGIGRKSWKVSDDLCNRVSAEAIKLKKATPDWRY